MALDGDKTRHLEAVAAGQIGEFERRRRRQMDPEPLVDQRQVAQHLGVSEKTVERYRKRQPPLPARKLFAQGAVRFRLTEVDKWVEEQSAALQVSA